MAQILDTLYVEGQVYSSTQGVLLGSFDEMPEATGDMEGVIVYYFGEEGEYTPHSFYLCLTEDDGRTWTWHPLVLALDTLAAKVENAVPKDTTINGHALGDGDITLTYEDVGALPADTFIPTKVSDLSNDGVFITQDVSTLANYFTKRQTSRLMARYCRLYVADAFPEDDAIDPNGLYSVPDADGTRRLYYRADGQWVAVA